MPTDAYDSSFPELTHVYLEDSWVLAVEHQERTVEFVLDAVLTDCHPEYSEPSPAEQHCYRRARLVLRSGQPVGFERSGAPPATDASGERDLGHIDVFAPVDSDGRDAWELSGDWGSARVVEPVVSLTFDRRP